MRKLGRTSTKSRLHGPAVIVGALLVCFSPAASAATHWTAGVGVSSSADAEGNGFSPPTNPTAATASSSSLTISWTAPASGAGPTSYALYRSTSSSGPFVEITTSGDGCKAPATSPCTDNVGLSADTTYYYEVYDYVGTNWVSSSAVFSGFTGAALVEQVVNGGAALTSVSLTLGSATTVGDTLVLSVADDSNHNATVSGVSGGGVGTWMKATSAAAHTALEGEAEIWYGLVTTSSASAVTVTLSGSTNGQLANVSEWTGIATSSPLDAATSVAPGVAATNFTAGPITTSVANDLVISDAWTAATGDTSPQDATSGYTELSETTGGGSYYRGWGAYQDDTSTGSISATWTAPSSAYYATAIAAFEP